MKRICLVSYTNIYVLPYARLYIEEIIRSGNQCCLLYWDRDKKPLTEEVNKECISFRYKKYVTGEDSKGLTSKAIGYFEATRYFKNVIRKECFDKLIFLETHGAILCSGAIMKRYNGKYIVDVRDYSVENVRPLYAIEKKVIKNSAFTVISSPAYQSFLPKGDYVVSHNYVPFTQSERDRIRCRFFYDDPIRISFIGTVRFIDMDKKLLSLFQNDNRFKICYFGRGSEVLEEYCKLNGINNVEFHGAFKSSETASFYEITDIINNLYGNHSNYLDYALSNKLYHAAQFYLPILVCKDTYMQEVATKYDLGFVFDFDKPSIKDDLYRWYNSYDRVKLKKGADSFLTSVENDNQQFFCALRAFLGE